MRLLIDTNIVLEVFLDQERSEESKLLLSQIDQHELYLSDFSLHSIGILLFRQKKIVVFQQFVEDLIDRAGLGLVNLPIEDLVSLLEKAQSYQLDFDDAYQYMISKRYNLELISFDNDFDRTDLHRKTPREVTNV